MKYKVRKPRDIEKERHYRRLLNKQKSSPKSKFFKFDFVVTLFFGLLMGGVFVYLLYNTENIPDRKKILQQVFEERIQVNSDLSSRPELGQKCRVPQLSVYTPEIFDVLAAEKPKNVNCAKKVPLLFDTDLENNLILLNDPLKLGYTDCCYSQMIRPKTSAETKVKFLKPCIPIENEKTKIPANMEFIAVQCYKIKSNGTKLGPKYMDMFTFPALPKDKIEETTEDALSVVVLGLDAMSRMNFLRTMPKTNAYLQTIGSIALTGYNKIADNTYPNLVAALTSHNERELMSICLNNTPKKSHFDKCPFIWKKFKEKGYVTVYGEDAPHLAIFNYLKKGFKNPPADYYNRVLSVGLNTHISSNGLLNANICYGPRLGFNVLLRYMKQMANLLKGRKYFEFIWATSLSHDYAAYPALGDESLMNYLKWMKSENHLNKTVFVLMSDHGMRFGPLRSTAQGKLEERLPFVYFVFPDWFHKKYPTAVSILKSNVHRLTSPYDLYETLEDMLEIPEKISEENLNRRELQSNWTKANIPRGISLFLPVPLYRDCELAHIPDQWCTCKTQIRMPTNNAQVVTAAAQLLISMNKMIRKFPKCAPLHLKSIQRASKIDTQDNPQYESMFDLSIMTTPGNGKFQAVVLKSSEDDGWKVSDSLSRVNLYGNQSFCVDEKEMKKICFCKGLITSLNTSGKQSRLS